MSLMRRAIMLAVAALIAAVSLALAASASAAIKPPTHPAGVALLASQDAKDDALAECRAAGGTWTEAPDPHNLNWRIGTCTWQGDCTWKEVDIGIVKKWLVTFRTCVTKTKSYTWSQY